jgi:hypothetical protein
MLVVISSVFYVDIIFSRYIKKLINRFCEVFSLVFL